MTEKQKVIFRTEYNKYTKQWGYLAIFPDDEANPGYIGATPFYINEDGSAMLESYSEINLNYMYGKKIIHKNDPRIPELMKVLEKYYNEEYEVVEKIMRR